jgi:hypothetical protein
MKLLFLLVTTLLFLIVTGPGDDILCLELKEEMGIIRKDIAVAQIWV